MGNIDNEFSEKLKAAGMNPVPASQSPHGHGPGEGKIQITIDGVGPEDESLVKLLEDTAKFVRESSGRVGAKPFTETGISFERLDLKDIVALKHRS